MRTARIKLALFITFAALAVAVVGSPAFAQEAAAGEGDQMKSFFSTFFSSPDLLGSIMIWTLIAMSVAVMSLSIEAILSNRTKVLIPPERLAEYEALVEDKRYKEMLEVASTDNSPLGQTLYGALQQASHGYGAMERAVEEYADTLGSQRIRKLEYLNVLGAVGPMAGLFGTVYGMIIAFQAMVSAGGQPKPAELAGGVSTALVNTFWGLVVGIPAIMVAALVRNHIEGKMVEVMIRVESLIARFRPAKKPAGATLAPAKPAPGVAAGVAAKPRPA